MGATYGKSSAPAPEDLYRVLGSGALDAMEPNSLIEAAGASNLVLQLYGDFTDSRSRAGAAHGHDNALVGAA